MPDLTDDIFDGEFDVIVSYTPFGGSSTNISAIFSKGMDPGRESGKGLTSAIRAIEAEFARIIIKQSEVATKPEIHSTIIYGGVTHDILSAQDTGAGSWRLETNTSVNHRRNNR